MLCRAELSGHSWDVVMSSVSDYRLACCAGLSKVTCIGCFVAFPRYKQYSGSVYAYLAVTRAGSSLCSLLACQLNSAPLPLRHCCLVES